MKQIEFLLLISIVLAYCYSARCGQLLYNEDDAAREIASPGYYTDGYVNNMNCEYQIQAKTGSKVTARFEVGNFLPISANFSVRFWRQYVN